MIKYEIGKPFPEPQYHNRGEFSTNILNANFFDILLSIYNISDTEKKAWKTGNFTLYLFEKDSIPFIILDFGNDFTIDVNINIHILLEIYLKVWLNSKANMINLFLVDADTNNLVALRVIGINLDIAENIRNICKKQLNLFKKPSDFSIQVIENKISKILKTIPAKEMMENSLKKQSF